MREGVFGCSRCGCLSIPGSMYVCVSGVRERVGGRGGHGQRNQQQQTAAAGRFQLLDKEEATEGQENTPERRYGTPKSVRRR